ncbi:MAG: hypothetical protein GY722_00845 [bacterium]|nr:hypothetical protein [bacterium]
MQRLALAVSVVLSMYAAAAVVKEPSSMDAKVHFPIDHVAWILDQETLDALAESPMLQNEFANSGVHKRGDGGDWGALILYGSRTQYLEFRAEVRQPGLDVAPDDTMVAFNAEKEGSVDWIIARMSEKYPESNPSKSLKKFKRGGEEIPQSHVASFYYETGAEGLGAWVLEIHQEFKNRASGGRTKIGDISRVRYGPPVRHHPDKYFKDVVSVTVAVSDTRRRNLVNLLTELGYEIKESDDIAVCTGEENVVELIPKTNQKYAISRIEMSLMRPKEGQKVYRFGPDIVLTFADGPEAVWEFGGLAHD